MIRGVFHSKQSSRMDLKTKIWSQHDLPGLNLACSYRTLSTSFFTLFKRMVQKSFPTEESNVIPLHLLQSPRSPFLGNLTMTPSRHSWVGVSLFQISLKKLANIILISHLVLSTFLLWSRHIHWLCCFSQFSELLLTHLTQVFSLFYIQECLFVVL